MEIKQNTYPWVLYGANTLCIFSDQTLSLPDLYKYIPDQVAKYLTMINTSDPIDTSELPGLTSIIYQTNDENAHIPALKNLSTNIDITIIHQKKKYQFSAIDAKDYKKLCKKPIKLICDRECYQPAN